MSSVWELREQVHALRPDLKPQFVVEYEEDKVRYDKLSEVSREAHKLEDAGRVSEARSLFLSLYSLSKRGYFRMVAEAGLYRLCEPGKTTA